MLMTLLSLASCQDIPQTVVTAPRAARSETANNVSHQVVSAKELEATGERSLPRAIAKATGLYVQETNLGGGAPIVRGLIGNQILIVVDGVRLNDATTRGGPNQSLNSIDPTFVERVEVIRGPTSVLYGSDALGGVILIWTKNRPAGARDGVPEGIDPRHIEFGGDYDSATNGGRGWGLASSASESGGILVGGSLHEWNKIRSADGDVENTGYHGQSAFASIEQMLGSTARLRFTASRTRDFDVPRTDRMNTGFGQTQPADAENVFTLEDRERYALALNVAESMQVRLSMRKYTEERRIRSTGSSTRRLEHDDTETVGVGADWRLELGNSNLLTWGLDADFDDVDSIRRNQNIDTGVVTNATGAFQPESEYLSTGAFVQDELLLGEDFAVTAGARYSYFEFGFEDAAGDDVDGDFDAVTGSLAGAWHASESAQVTATIAQGFRAPNLSELARTATFAGGTENANPDLDPERSLYEELALDLRRPAWSWSTAVYHNFISDVVGRRLIADPNPGQTGDEIYLRDNTGDVELYGIETRAKRKLGDERAPFAIEAYLEYTYGQQYDDFVDVNGDKPFDDEPSSKVPPLHGRLALLWEPAEPTWGLGWADFSVWFADEQDRLSPADKADPRIDPDGTDGWVRLDLDFGGSFGKRSWGAKWNAGVHNILDESYRVHGSGFDAPGIGAVAGLSFSI
jgi:outer membrane receptor protein involved in Fe transport